MEIFLSLDFIGQDRNFSPTFAVRSYFGLAAERKSCNCNSRFRKSL